MMTMVFPLMVRCRAVQSDDTRRFEAYGWHVIRNVDGHDADEIAVVIEAARESDKPL